MNYEFIKGTFNESDLEKAIIELFEIEGYSYVHGDDIHRKYEDIILEKDLIDFLKYKYSAECLSEKEIKSILSVVKNIGSGATLYLRNKEAYYLITCGFDFIRDDSSKLPLHISFIDFENTSNNIFKVVNQYSVVQGTQTRIPDLLVFINGIPICICEFKTAVKEDTTIYDAYKQINIRYNRDIDNLTKYCFLSLLSDGANTRIGTIFTPYEFYYSWNKANDEDKVSNGISSLLTMIKGAFSKERILSILRDFIYYPESENDEIAIVCRYPQFFAAHKMTESVISHLKPNGDGKGGTYFGATGCGKTYTMLFMSKLIVKRHNDVFNNPTILVITDREDLNNQTSSVFEGAKRYLQEDDIHAFDSRDDLAKTLKDKQSGGVYITTIQKFCESTGLLSDRNNIICISDEAHRTQVNVVSKVKETEEGIIDTHGFGECLRLALPNATYCGFTGTPIDETLAVFGPIVDKYTMKESSDDGITVRIAYEPRLARVIVNEDMANKIEEYYKQCEDAGANKKQIEASKKAMASISKILGHPTVLHNLAVDIVDHYEKLTSEKPNITQKAMVVCPDRPFAKKLLDEIKIIKPAWFEEKKTENDKLLSKDELAKLNPISKIKLVATQGENDEKSLYELCGTSAYRKTLDAAFKNKNSNFKIALVVDMWITGFDVPSLAVMYICKPLQKHTLIQTISRVNRVFDGKDKGLVVDYIGFKTHMMEALKIYGNIKENPIDEIKATIDIFRNQIDLINKLLCDFDSRKYFDGSALERLVCIGKCAEYIQLSKETTQRFMLLSIKMKNAYELASASGELTKDEIAYAHFYMAVRSVIFKETKPDVPDTEVMNKKVEEMVKNALSCTGVENIVNPEKEIDIFSEDFLKELEKVKMPISKFNALLKLLKKAISEYGKYNKIKSLEFSEMLKHVIDKYNSRDNFTFTSKVVEDFVDDLSQELLNILNKLKEDRASFEKLGITFEEKAFYDILVKVRDTNQFEYNDDKCILLAREIKKLIDDKSQYADWSTQSDIKNQLNEDLTVLLYENGYPPEWDEEVFNKVLEQAENFKKYN